VAAETVEGPDRRISVWHPDVDVQSPDRSSDRISEQVADALVALLVGDLGLTLHRRRMRPRPKQPRPRRDDRPAQTAERTYRLASASTDVRDELHLTRVQLALDRSFNRTEPLQHGR